jgi:hypothetical protein
MSDVLTVQTPFGDIADLAQGYIGRVNARQIVVAVSEAAEPGQVVRFQVLLADGTLAFWGDGHCAQVNDLGDDADPNGRFELLLHSLEFPDERSLPVFEYMVSLSESATPNEELTASEESGFTPAEAGTDEVGTGDLEALSVPPMEDVTPSVPPVEAAAFDAAPIEDDLPRALSDRPGPPPGGLTRMATGNAWRPVRPERQPPAPRSGLFKYPFGALPIPTRPPRPEIDPALCVTAAPRPGA